MLAIFYRVVERERGNLSERTKAEAGVARARDEGEHIGRPFREINWRKVDEYRAKGLSWSAISRGDGHILQHAACGKGVKSGERELKV